MNKQNQIIELFLDVILTEFDMFPLILFDYYNKQMKNEFKDVDIVHSLSSYSNYVSKIYEDYDVETTQDPMESDRFKLLEKFIEISEQSKIKPKCPIEKLKFMLQMKENEITQDFMNINFIYGIHPLCNSKLEE